MDNNSKSHRILIADDSPTVTGILGYIFGEEGWVVDAAADGVEALRRFFANPPDLVVLDIEMPRMNGYQVCRIIKNDLEMSSIPVIILTSRDLQSDRFRGLSAGADAYIVKDLEDDQLLATVKNFLANRDKEVSGRLPRKNMGENEILQAVNGLLDKRLFIGSVTSKVEEISSRTQDYDAVKKEVLKLLSAVFEFVVAGIAIVTQDNADITTLLHEGFPDELSNEFNKLLKEYLESNLKVKQFSLPDVTRHTASGFRQFPVTTELLEPKFWPLASGGKVFGAIGMAGTAPLKFHQDSIELLTAFIGRAAIVLDNARLMQSQKLTNDALSAAIEELKTTQLQLIQTEKMASLGQLMAGLAHEMNNPLNFVTGNIDYIEQYSESLLTLVDHAASKMKQDNEYMELLKEKDYEFIREDMPGMIRDMREGTNRARMIITDLRTFSSPDQSETSPIDLATIIESTVSLIKHQWSGEIALKTNYLTNKPVECHPGQLSQVTLNLIGNAITSIKETGRTDGEIDITLRREDNWIEFTVADNGKGIESKNIDKLFQPFFTTKEVGKGMGLGLSISYGIIKRHGGDILVKSELGVGSTFTVRMPIVE